MQNWTKQQRQYLQEYFNAVGRGAVDWQEEMITLMPDARWSMNTYWYGLLLAVDNYYYLLLIQINFYFYDIMLFNIIVIAICIVNSGLELGIKLKHRRFVFIDINVKSVQGLQK